MHGQQNMKHKVFEPSYAQRNEDIPAEWFCIYKQHRFLALCRVYYYSSFWLFVGILLGLLCINCRHLTIYINSLWLNLLGVSYMEVIFTATISFFGLCSSSKLFLKNTMFRLQFCFRLQVDVYTSDIRRVHTGCLIESYRALTMLYDSLTKSIFWKAQLFGS